MLNQFNVLKSLFVFLIIGAIILTLSNCNNNMDKQKKEIFNKNNLVAWCIIPYDSVKRNAVERARMLNELGITKLAYDWRPEHLNDMENEFEVMQKNKIDIISVWFWVDGSSDKIFDENNEFIVKTLRENNIKTELWIGMPENLFDAGSESEKLERAKTMVDYTYKRAKEIGCKISLYNHGGWFGNPKNQLKLIEKLGYDDIGIVFNFHHGHDQLDVYEENIKLIRPYLTCVNINGMKKDGLKILPVGKGNLEIQMLKLLFEQGYTGPVGILGHVENADVKVVLGNNLKGIEDIERLLN